MPEAAGSRLSYQSLSVGLATLAISAVFIGMIWNFLMALFLAAVFSAMAAPLYRKICSAIGNRAGLAAGLTVLLLVVCVLAPLTGLIYLAAVQAGELTSVAVSFVQSIEVEGPQYEIPAWVPFRDQLESAGPTITAKIGELAGSLARYFVSALAALTKGTASFFLSFFILVYAMIFFLQEQTGALRRILSHSGLSPDAQTQLVERTVSISRATIKGTLVIGIVQGALGGIGFAVTGIQGAAFWGAVMAIASVIPGIGPSLILIPGIIYLFAIGQTGYAVGLALWTVLAVTTVDNLLRPALVGRDTQMPDLMILVSTLGGLAMFGAVGLVVGPVIAGIFLTLWGIFRETFGEPESSA